MNEIKDPVGLQINNTEDELPPYTNNIIYEREVLTKWILHNEDATSGILQWKIIEL